MPPLDRLELDDDERSWSCGSVLVNSVRKLQNAHVSTTRALPEWLVVAATIVVSVRDRGL
jgi:hypothetical protein